MKKQKITLRLSQMEVKKLKADLQAAHEQSAKDTVSLIHAQRELKNTDTLLKNAQDEILKLEKESTENYKFWRDEYEKASRVNIEMADKLCRIKVITHDGLDNLDNHSIMAVSLGGVNGVVDIVYPFSPSPNYRWERENTAAQKKRLIKVPLLTAGLEALNRCAVTREDDFKDEVADQYWKNRK